MYSKGTVLKIKNGKGTFVSATILEFADFHGVERMWWLEHFENGRKEVSVFTEDDLIEWNKERDCTCGAKATHSPNTPPGHAYYCDAVFKV